jgi:hypothetical protein
MPLLQHLVLDTLYISPWLLSQQDACAVHHVQAGYMVGGTGSRCQRMAGASIGSCNHAWSYVASFLSKPSSDVMWALVQDLS